MKYLRRFNEQVEDPLLLELENFCQEALVYLNDDHIWANVYTYEGKYGIEISTDQNYRSEYFDWDEVKEEVIPFLIELNNRYEIRNNGNKSGDIVHFIRRWTADTYTIKQQFFGLDELEDLELHDIKIIEINIIGKK